jgi:acetylornithine/succinyldiaminopimelate/putrescine aminotransferase
MHELGNRYQLLVVDEVQTGFGRTGRMFACDHHALGPDLLCLGKALGGGLPMGAVALGPRVARLTPGIHGSTFGGNPLACAAALASLEVLEEEELPARALAHGEHLLTRLRALDSPAVREVRGLGLMIGIELKTRVTPYLEALLERGILALPAGATVLRLLPPLNTPLSDLDEALDVLAELLRQDAPR